MGGKATNLFAIYPPTTSTTMNMTARTSAMMSFCWTCVQRESSALMRSTSTR